MTFNILRDNSLYTFKSKYGPCVVDLENVFCIDSIRDEMCDSKMLYLRLYFKTMGQYLTFPMEGEKQLEKELEAIQTVWKWYRECVK